MPAEVSNTIQQLKNSSNLSDIPTKFLKMISSHLETLLSNLFNECLSLGIYPNSFKTALVQPRYKSGSRKSILNYRPISILPVLGKVFERLIFKRLYNFVTNSGIISPNQFGFIKNKSTSQANLKLIHTCLPALNKETYTLSVFLDFSKAFECVNHKILLDKMYRYGIRGNSNSLIKSYLSNRRQRVKIDDILSDEVGIDVGVPQGSCNGPLFYLLYANDLNRILDGVSTVMFADDTVVSISGTNINEIVQKMNDALNRIFQWCCFNKLTINSEKSKALFFGLPRNFCPPLVLINGTQIKYFDDIKYLGIFIDRRLTFNKQISHIETNLLKYKGIAWNISPKLDLSSAKNFYFSYVYSLITYGATVWGGKVLNSACTRTKQLWHATFLNLFSRHFPGESVKEICRHLNILNIEDSIVFTCASECYKFKSRGLFEFFHLSKPQPNNYVLRNNRDLLVPLPKSNADLFNYEYNLSKVWNDVPEAIRNKTTLSGFKTKFKELLIANY